VCKTEKNNGAYGRDIIRIIFTFDNDAQGAPFLTKEVTHLWSSWVDLISSYKRTIVLLGEKADFTDCMINECQEEADNFCARFRAMFGPSAITSYIHDLEAGHARFFLKRFRNLFRNSNIGLEAYIRVLRGTCTRRVQCKGDLHEHVGKFMQRSAAIITEGHNPGYIENAVQSFKAANVNPVGRPRKNA
jgi:hypothetical protein